MKNIIKKIIILFMAVSMFFTATGCDYSMPPEADKPQFFTAVYSAEVINEYNSDGYINGECEQTIEKGKDGSVVEAKPHYGYKFKQWSDGVTNAIRQDKNIQADLAVTANFEKLDTFELNYIASEGGSLDGISKQEIPLGKDAMPITAMPNKGYAFAGWSDGVETAQRLEKNVMQNLTVTAYFEIGTLTLQYAAGENGRIDGKANQSIIPGGNGEVVTAVPNVGYKFIEWSDNKSTNPIRADGKVTKNINAAAKFGLVFEDGSGTIEKPILVNSYQEFLNIRLQSNLYYKLNADLDLSDNSHEPLFNGASSHDGMFNGIFDGNGHTISNMKIDTYLSNPSLFGYVNKGTIKNINITDFDITVQDFDTAYGVMCVGGVAAGTWGELNNVHTKGIIQGDGFTYDGVAIGGLAGQAGGTVLECSSDVAIELSNITRSNTTNTPFNVGGLIGVGFADIKNCETRGTLKMNQTHGDVWVGGLVGIVLVNGGENYTIRDCNTNIAITMGNTTFNEDGSIVVGGGTPVKSGGLIGSAEVIGQLTIDGCGVTGNITGGGHAGGLISYVTGHGTSKTIIQNSFVKNDMAMASGAGFIYWVTNKPASVGIFEVTNSYSQGNIHANIGSGFCNYVLSNAKIYRCYSTRNIQSMAMTAGFIQQMMGGTIEECFSMGTITVKHQAVGFIFFGSGTTVKNCYSTCDITVTNIDPDSNVRTYACGIVAIGEISIIKTYYSGKISGFVYTSPFGQNSIVGDFAGEISNSQITNCHLLFYKDTFATDIVVGYYSPVAPLDLTIYNSVAQMNNVVDKLNESLSEPIWVEGANGLPQLKFMLT